MTTRASAVLLAAGLAAAPAWADKKLDDAKAKAETQLQKSKPDDAMRTLQKLVDDRPGDAEAHAALALLYERLGEIQKAEESYTKAAQVAASASASAKSAALAAVASFQLRNGPARQAAATAEQAVQAEASALALAALARAQARLRNPAALQTAERAVQAGAISAEAHVARGDALLASKPATDAVAAFRKALALARAMRLPSWPWRFWPRIPSRTGVTRSPMHSRGRCSIQRTAWSRSPWDGSSRPRSSTVRPSKPTGRPSTWTPT